MDIFFQDPTAIPLPPEEVRIRNFSVKPYPEGRRVRVRVELDPFQKRPSLEIEILNGLDEQVAQARVIETMGRTLEITLHLREEQPGGRYSAHARLYYQEEPSSDGDDYPQPEVVDQRQASFSIESSSGSNPVTNQL